MLVTHFKLKIIFIRAVIAMMQNQTKVAWTVCKARQTLEGTCISIIIGVIACDEDRFLISWATCDRVGVLCTQAKADPCFFVRSAGRSSFQRHFE